MPSPTIGGRLLRQPARRAVLAGAAVLSLGGLAALALTTNHQASAVPAPTPSPTATNITTCAQVGLSGEIILEGTGDATSAAGSGDVSADGLFLDVTINEGWTASGIVVKGGPGANVYRGPFVGPTTIEDMRAPDNPGGQQAQISHWFVCGGPTASPSPTVSPTMSPTPSPTVSPTPSPTVSPTRPPRPTPTRPSPGYGYGYGS